MLNENWDRWIFASISQHFETNCGTFPMYIEGMKRDTSKLPEFFELRIDGPYYTEYAKDQWTVYVEINTLIQVTKDKTDFHKMRRRTGQISAIMEPCIILYRYGDTAPDDQEQFGYLERIDGDKERIQTSHFGQIEPRFELEQSTVEAHYRAMLP